MTNKSVTATFETDDDPSSIFQVMRDEREQVLRETENLNKSLTEALYERLRLPIGIVFLVLGGMQNQLYAWSHDFATKKYVGVPVSNRFVGFTGAEWEFFNIFFAQGSAIVFALLGGYYVGRAIWSRDAEIHLDRKKLESIRGMKGVRKETREEIDSYLQAKRRWIPDMETDLMDDHPHLYRINAFLRSRWSLPLSLLAHTLVLSAIHYTWSQRYFEGKTYVAGVVHESVFWNWTWFIGAYSTYLAVCLSSYYFFYNHLRSKPARMAHELRRKITKHQDRFSRIGQKRRDSESRRLQKRYIATLDRIILLEKELKFWEALE